MAFIDDIPPRIIDPAGNAIRAGFQVLGNGTWQPTAQALNWALGKGGSLVIAGPSSTAIAPGSSATFHYYHWPRKQNPYQLWTIGIALSPSTTGGASGTIEIPSGTSLATWELDDNVSVSQPVTFAVQRAISSPSGTAGEITVKVTNDSISDADILVTGICGYELPRVALDSFTASKVVDDQTLATGAPIYDATGDEKSINAVCVNAPNAVTEARRSCLLSWFYGTGVTITAGSFPGTSNILRLDPSIVARHLYNGTNTYTVKVAVYAKMNGASPAGDVKLTAQSGGSVTLHFTSTGAAWRTGDLVVETEDLSRLGTDGGLRGGSRETLKNEGRKTAGTSITVYGICIAEAT